MSEFDLRALLEALHERDVRFVVIGGVAVGAHGFVRGTEDLDLVPDPDPENLERLAVALEEMKSTLPTAGRLTLRPTPGDSTSSSEPRVFPATPSSPAMPSKANCSASP